MRCFLCLGAQGDVLNVVQGLKWYADQQGHPVDLVIDVSVAPIVEACSYIRAIKHPTQDYKDVHPAIMMAQRMGYLEVRVCQMRGRNWEPPIKTESYASDARLLVGAPESAWEVPILFDQRNKEREAEFVASLNLDADRPLVLFNGKGYSSPFRNELELLEMIRTEVPDAQVLNMGRVRAKRLYDLLALYERAACLVSVDTSTAHLAGATPRLPVVALISDRNSDWSGSKYPPTVNVVASSRYRSWRENYSEMAEAVRASVFTPAR
jgi:hypothetical protein